MKTRKGFITVSRFNSTDETFPAGISITINIELDGKQKRFAEVRLTIPQFGDLLSGLGYVNCDVKIYDVKG